MPLKTSASRLAGAAFFVALAPNVAMAEPTDLVIATAQIPVHLDPLSSGHNVNWRFTHNVLESLINYNEETGEFEPGLASSWTFVEPTVLELTLNEGITCHNGEVFNAEDVEIAFGPKRFFNKDLPAHTVGKQFFPYLKSAEAIDELTVRLTTEVPDPLLPLRLSTASGALPCGDAYLAADSWESWGNSVVGTGPYMLSSFEPNEENGFKAFAEYRGAKPRYDSFVFQVVPELATRVAGLLAGDFHIIGEVTPDQFRSIEQGNARVEGGPINNIRLIIYDQNHPALKDARVRRALSLSIDRQLLIDTIFDGRTTVPNGLQLETFGNMYIEDHNPTGYDPDLARKLLEEAGYDGEEISYRYRLDYYGGEVIAAQVLQQMWQAVGLNVKLELKENFDEITGAAGAKGRGIHNWSLNANYPDPDIQIWRGFGPNGTFQNNGTWVNARFNEWGADLASTDPQKRRAAMIRLLEIYESDPPGTYLHILPTFQGVASDVTWTAGATQFMDFRALKDATQ